MRIFTDTDCNTMIASNTASNTSIKIWRPKIIHVVFPLCKNKNYCKLVPNLVPRACDPREGTRGSGIIRCRKPGILAKIELRIPFQRPIRFLPETDYPRASRSFPRIAGSGNEIDSSPGSGPTSYPVYYLRSINPPFLTVPTIMLRDGIF